MKYAVERLIWVDRWEMVRGWFDTAADAQAWIDRAVEASDLTHDVLRVSSLAD